MRYFNTLSNQRGAATLIFAVLVLVALTIVSFTGMKVGVTEQRISANDKRAKEAFAWAEAGIEKGIVYLNANNRWLRSANGSAGWLNPSNGRWVACSSTETALPCGDGVVNKYGNTWLKYADVANLREDSNPNATTLTSYTHRVHFLTRALTTPSTPGPSCTQVNVSAVVSSITAIICLPLVNTLVATAPLISSLPPSPAQLPDNPTIIVISEATSTDPLAGNARITQIVQASSVVVNPPPAPLVVNGTVHLTGNKKIWGNPRPPSTFSFLTVSSIGLNGNPLNVTFPLSVWSSGLVSLQGSMSTCLPGYTLAGITIGGYPNCIIELSTSRTLILGGSIVFAGPDIVDNPPPTFPNDLFLNIFGIPWTSSALVKSEAQVITDCDYLRGSTVPEPAGLFWITGNCNINFTAGKRETPIVLIVENGEFRMSSGGTIYGLVFVKNGDVRLTGGPVMFGAVVNEGNLDIGAGNFNLVYDWDVLRRAGYLGGSFAKLPGAWVDN